MSSKIVEIGRLTVTRFVGPNRVQMLEIDVGEGKPMQLYRPEAKRVADAILRWWVETLPAEREKRRRDG